MPQDHHHATTSGHGHQHGHGHDDDILPNLLDIDAEVARPQIDALTAHIAEITTNHPVKRILDIGSGTGTGTFALLRRFPDATSTAVDTSADMLRRLTEAARQHGLADRVRTLQADLDGVSLAALGGARPEATGTGRDAAGAGRDAADAGLDGDRPAVGPADLIWASSSIHHMADPDRVLRDIRSTLAPGGLFVMIEMDTMPYFLPAGHAGGLENRCQAAASQARAEHLPHIGSDWPARLEAAGLSVLEARLMTVEVPAPLSEKAQLYATTVLGRYRTTLADRLSATDLAALDELLAPGALAALPGVAVRSTRDVYFARPPSQS
ncbi:class I SAM-dependent methyltransferase [Actinoplanes sp. NPDC023936]|uniref:class I SAM-dependent methyltransferase n=1 Tax=Actinoplanes sp. NPDC023936 TaxID=3154910 RepID=UPI0033EC5482